MLYLRRTLATKIAYPQKENGDIFGIIVFAFRAIKVNEIKSRLMLSLQCLTTKSRLNNPVISADR